MERQMSLNKLFQEHEGKACGKWSHYMEIYEKHLNKFVGKEVLLFEIGVCKGGSLQIWKKFLGKNCKIVGFDIDPYSVYSEDQITVEHGDGTDYGFLRSMIEKYGTPDIVIDDGSHIQSDIMASFAFLFPQLNTNGVYVIEDTHTAYRKEYSGGINSPFNINTILSRAVHDPSFQFIEEDYTPSLPIVSGLCFYNSMIVVEKGDGEDVTPWFTGDEKHKNVQSTKPHSVSQVTMEGLKEIDKKPDLLQEDRQNKTESVQQRQYPPQTNQEPEKDPNDQSDGPKITPESIKYARSIPYPPQSEFDQRPPSTLSEDEESLFKWHV